MQLQSFNTLPKRSPRFIPLRHRVVLATSGMLILLLGVLVVTLVWVQNRTIKQQLEQRGKAIGQSLVATSTNALLSYDYITLEQFANRAAQDPNILYVAVHDKEDRVAGFSNRPDLQGKNLTDKISLNAVTATTPLIQEIEAGTAMIPGLEVTTPVYLPDSKQRWGIIRVCLSLAPLYQQMLQTVWIITAIGLVALVIGVLISILGARRVTRPLGNLAQATMQVAQGNFEELPQVKTGDEVELLATNFSLMARKILEHQEKQAQQLNEIQRLQNYTEMIMSTMADGLVSLDMKGRIATINPAARQLLGVSLEDDIQGASIASISGESSQLYIFIRNMLKKPAAYCQQEVEIKEEEKPRTLLVGSSLLSDTKGEPRELILNLHDITELKKLEARIRQSERLAALGTLAAGMAHEIRNPLSAIKTFVQLLPRKIDKPGFLEKFNRTVPRETNRINLLVEELLELSRAPKYTFSNTDINSLIRQTLDTIEDEVQRRNIDCRLVLQSNLPHVQADAHQLVKAFQNLSRNAIQATPAGGRLTIRTFTESEPVAVVQKSGKTTTRIAIIFEDTGQGIPANLLKEIFNPFFTTKDYGTGLGLPITHKVISEHGGLIEAESDREQGTRFTIYLPCNK